MAKNANKAQQDPNEELIARLKKENAELKNTVKEQADELKVAEATRPKNAKPVVNVDGQRYRVDHGVRTGSKNLSREDVAGNLELCRELIGKKSSALTHIPLK